MAKTQQIESTAADQLGVVFDILKCGIMLMFASQHRAVDRSYYEAGGSTAQARAVVGLFVNNNLLRDKQFQ